MSKDVRVRLSANEELGQSEQFGVLLDPEPDNGTYCVRLDESFKAGEEDDGIREVPEDQVEVLG